VTVLDDAPPPRPPVDPRIRARRIEVRRQQGRRRLRVLTALVVAAAVIALAVAAAFSGLFEVDEVVVDGAQRADPDQIVAASGIERGEALLTLRPGRTAARVAGVPWVAEAEVGRSLTGRVTITVRERQAVAAVPARGGAWVLVDAEGRQLAAVPRPGPGELVLFGTEASGVPGEPVGAGAQSVLRLLDALTPAVREATGGVGLDDEDLVLDLNGGGRVRLGDAAGLEAKLVALETMLDRVDLRCLDELNLVVPSAPALTRDPPPAGDPEDALSDLSECP
jgi:cell division protein FtsQ